MIFSVVDDIDCDLVLFCAVCRSVASVQFDFFIQMRDWRMNFPLFIHNYYYGGCVSVVSYDTWAKCDQSYVA